MALKSQLMYRYFPSGTSPSLTARVGEGYLVKNIFVNPSSASYIYVYVEKTIVGCFRVKGVGGNHLPFSFSRFDDVTNATRFPRPSMLTILDFLRQWEIFKGYPVAEGQTLTISADATPIGDVLIEYEVYDSADVKNTMDNGSHAKNYVYINYGRVSDDISTAGDTLFEVSIDPKPYPAFPFGDVVPSNTVIEIHGFLFSDFSPSENDGTDEIYTRYLKMFREREVLFDDDKNGLLVAGKTGSLGYDAVGEGLSVVGNYSDVDGRLPLMFFPPLVFGSGDELPIFLTTAIKGSGQTITPDEVELGVIELVKRVG